jgi:hypothetical protein
MKKINSNSSHSKHDISNINLSSCLHMSIQKAHSQYPLDEQDLKLCETKLYVAYLMQTNNQIKISKGLVVYSIDISLSSQKD